MASRRVGTIIAGAAVAAAADAAAVARLRPRPSPATGTAQWQPLAPVPVPEADHLDAPHDADAIDSTDGSCPVSHPVKGNLDSGIFHVPGGLSYDRTRAERCYRTPEAAEADGLRPAKR